MQKRIDQLSECIDSVDWEDKRIYAAYMAQTYYYVRHSTRLLALAGGLMPFEHQAGHLRFMKHIGEEESHERLAEHDVKALGFTLNDFPELPSIKAFYQVQYYTVEHVSPWGLLGYIVALEGLAVGKGGTLHELVSKKFGTKAAAFLKVHAAEDIEHLEKAYQMVESLPSKEVQAIEENLELSCHLYEVMLRDLKRFATKKTESTGRGKKAA